LKRRTFIKRSLITAGALALPGRPALAGQNTLRFGLTPVFLSSDLTLLINLRQYLEKTTGQEVELVQRRTYQEITSLLVAGQLDAAWICGYPLVQFRDSLALMSVPVWRGQQKYQSYLIGKPDRQASSINDLKGDLHCFSDPNSNSGYLVTRALLADLNTRPDTYFKKAFFAYGHRNVVRAVSAGLAQSGSVDGYVWEVLNNLEPGLTEKTKVLWKSPWYGFPPIATPIAAAGTEQFKMLQRSLLNMHKDALGRSILDLLQLDSFGRPDAEKFSAIEDLVRKIRASG